MNKTDVTSHIGGNDSVLRNDSLSCVGICAARSTQALSRWLMDMNNAQQLGNAEAFGDQMGSSVVVYSLIHWFEHPDHPDHPEY